MYQTQYELIFPTDSQKRKYILEEKILLNNETLKELFSEKCDPLTYKNSAKINNANYDTVTSLLNCSKEQLESPLDINTPILNLVNKISDIDLIDYINTADYLGLDDIVAILSKKFRDLIKNNSIANIRKQLSIGDHFSSKDEETIKNDMIWENIGNQQSIV